MAENLLQFLFLLSMYLCIHKDSPRNTVILSMIIPIFIYTKYIAWPISVALFIALLIKSYTEEKKTALYKRRFVLIASTLVITLIVCLVLEAIVKMTNPLEIFLYHFNSLTQSVNTYITNKPGDESIYFWSIDYIPYSSRTYLFGYLGINAPLAGMYIKLLPPIS